MKKGFTLIELLIVIVIIGILSIAIVPNVMSAPKKARDSQRKQALNTLTLAIEQYALENNSTYPATACMDAGYNILNAYLKNRDVLLRDPSGSQDFGGATTCNGYYFEIDTNAKCYILAAKVEDTGNGNTGGITEKPAAAGKVDCGGATPFNPITLNTGFYFVTKSTF